MYPEISDMYPECILVCGIFGVSDSTKRCVKLLYMKVYG